MADEKTGTYLRDGRSPVPEKEITSKIMSSVRAKNTKPELMLRKSLNKNGLSGYRIHWRKTHGRPDICYPGRKLAIFIHGCFWHRCPHCNLRIPQSHTDFWEEKFRKNVARDKKKIKELEVENWKVLVLWECQIKNSLEDCINKIKELRKYKQQ